MRKNTSGGKEDREEELAAEDKDGDENDDEDEEDDRQRQAKAQKTCRYLDFNPTVVEYYATCLFIGPRMVGKTTACIILLRAMNLNRGFIQCGSPEWKKTWGKVVPMLYLQRGKAINKAFYESWMGQMEKVSIEIEKLVTQREKELDRAAKLDLKRETEAVKKKIFDGVEKGEYSKDKAYARFKRARDELQKKRLTVTQTEINRKLAEYKNSLAEPESLFAVLDDLGNGTRKGTLWSTEMQELMNMGRHYLAAVMVIIQNMMDFPPGIRQGLDWIFVWPGAMGTTEIDKLMKHYIPCEIFAERKDFMRALKEITAGQGKHTCMVIHRTGNSGNVRDRVFRWNPYTSALCKNGIPKGYLGHPDFANVGRRWYNGLEGYMYESEDPKQIRARQAARNKRSKGSGKTPSTPSNAAANAAVAAALTPEEKQNLAAEFERKWDQERKAAAEKGKRQGSRGGGHDVWKKATLGPPA